MAKWKVDRVTALWGITFGTAATLTGMFLMGAVEGGFLAEGFFLIVLSWVLLMVAVAKVADRLRRTGTRTDRSDEGPMEEDE